MTKKELLSRLKKLNNDELIELILDIRKEVKEVKKILDVKFSDDLFDSYVGLIEMYIDKEMSHGYVRANRAKDALKGVYIAIDEITKMPDSIDRLVALLNIFTLVTNIDSIDDSYGDQGTAIYTIIEYIVELVFEYSNKWDSNKKSIALNKIFLASVNPNNFGITDWRNEILLVSTFLCEDKQQYDSFTKHLNVLLKAAQKKDIDRKWNFETDRLLYIKYKLLSVYNQEESFKYLLDHLKLDDFKEEYLSILINKGDYKKVIETTDLFLKEEIYRNIKMTILKYRLKAEYELKDIYGIRETSYLLMINNELEYYENYKGTFNTKDFEEQIPHLLKMKDSGTFVSIRMVVIISENLQEEMIKDILEKPGMLFEYESYLNKASFLEVREVYENIILHNAKVSNKRSKYKKVCKLINDYTKAYNEFPIDLVIGLEKKYKNKKAFLDEISKLKEKHHIIEKENSLF